MLRALALLLLANPALAQDPSLPPELDRIVAESATFCDGDFSLAEGTLAQPDLNGDGTPDWLIDTAGFACSTGTEYCGLLGCTIYTHIDGGIGLLTLRSWEILHMDGETLLAAPDQQGLTARFRWSGVDWEPAN